MEIQKLKHVFYIQSNAFKAEKKKFLNYLGKINIKR